MTPIYTREELIAVAIRCAPTTATARRIRENGATVFGGVTSPEGFPGWIVDAGQQRLIGVWFDEAAHKYRITYPAALPDGAKILKGHRL